MPVSHPCVLCQAKRSLTTCGALSCSEEWDGEILHQNLPGSHLQDQSKYGFPCNTTTAGLRSAHMQTHTHSLVGEWIWDRELFQKLLMLASSLSRAAAHTWPRSTCVGVPDTLGSAPSCAEGRLGASRL